MTLLTLLAVGVGATYSGGSRVNSAHAGDISVIARCGAPIAESHAPTLPPVMSGNVGNVRVRRVCPDRRVT